jgi:hypothetical protein
LEFLGTINIPEWTNPNDTKAKTVFNWVRVK